MPVATVSTRKPDLVPHKHTRICSCPYTRASRLQPGSPPDGASWRRLAARARGLACVLTRRACNSILDILTTQVVGGKRFCYQIGYLGCPTNRPCCNALKANVDKIAFTTCKSQVVLLVTSTLGQARVRKRLGEAPAAVTGGLERLCHCDHRRPLPRLPVRLTA